VQVEVRLHFTLRKHGLFPDKPSFFVNLRENATVAELMAHLKIEAKKNLITLVDGRLRSSGSTLTEGSVVTVLEPVGGG